MIARGAHRRPHLAARAGHVLVGLGRTAVLWALTPAVLLYVAIGGPTQ